MRNTVLPENIYKKKTDESPQTKDKMGHDRYNRKPANQRQDGT